MSVTGYTEFSQLKVNDILQIGNSTLFLSSTQPSPGTIENSIYTTNGNLLIQCQSDPMNNFNTIINANNTGKVGIGTINPACNLDVYAEHAEIKAGNDQNYLKMGYNSSNAIIDNYGNGKLLINYYSRKNVVIGNESDRKNVDGGLTIWENVGIGTDASTTQELKLHVKGYTDISTLPGPGAELASAVVRIEDEAYGSGTGSDRTAWWDLVTSGKNQKFYIKTASSENSTLRNIMTLTEAGKVGIGTTEVHEAFQIGDDWTFHQNGTYAIARNFKYENNKAWRIVDGEVSIIKFEENGDLQFKTAVTGAAGSEIVTWNDGLCVKNDGNVGIGTTTPSEKLEVNGKVVITEGWRGLQINNGSRRMHFVVPESGSESAAAGFSGLGILDDSANEYRLIIDDQGKIGIGMIPTEMLTVKGRILAEEIEILSVPSSDYVFETDYNLLDLNELEKYLILNKHLPEVPSAAEFKANGYKVGEMDDLLLRKIEELTLYIIAQEKRIQQLEAEKTGNK